MSKRRDRRGFLNRRVFLKGLGGAVVAAPFLGSVGQRGVRAASVQPPARLIAMFTHYGCLTNRFFPEKSHGELAAADLEPTTLAPLAPFAKKLLLPRGIRAAVHARKSRLHPGSDLRLRRVTNASSGSRDC